MLVGSIFNGADGTISLMQAVHSLHLVSITVLMLVFVVTGVRVLNLVLELVLGGALNKKSKKMMNKIGLGLLRICISI